jgi:quercetin dioxygenase-like cupin family protein
MKIKTDNNVQAVPVEMDGAEKVDMKILVGPEDGSANIVLRLFIVAPGGHTPFHIHDFEHIVQVRAGRGAVIEPDGAAHDIELGQSVFVPPNEKHQFVNTSTEPFEFTCTILNPDRCGG